MTKSMENLAQAGMVSKVGLVKIRSKVNLGTRTSNLSTFAYFIIFRSTLERSWLVSGLVF